MTPRKARVPRIDFSDAVPFKIDGVYCKLISLTKKLFAIVDADIHPSLSRYNWQAHRSHSDAPYYAVRSAHVKGKIVTYQMHREVLGLPPIDGPRADHRKPWTTLDNRRANLRESSYQQNNFNRAPLKNLQTGLKGVRHGRGGRFRAGIMQDGKRINLGTFTTAKAAHQAYCDAAIAMRGEFFHG